MLQATVMITRCNTRSPISRRLPCGWGSGARWRIQRQPVAEFFAMFLRPPELSLSLSLCLHGALVNFSTPVRPAAH